MNYVLFQELKNKAKEKIELKLEQIIANDRLNKLE